MCQDCDCGGATGIPNQGSDWWVADIAVYFILFLAGWKLIEVMKFIFDAIFLKLFS